MSRKQLVPLDMNSSKIINLATPTSSTDASTKGYVDTGLAGKVSSTTTAKLTASATTPSSPSTGDVWIKTDEDIVDTVATASAAKIVTSMAQETPSGSVNGSNTVFTTLSPFTSGTLRVYLNGQRLKSGASYDYTEDAGLNSFTMNYAPATGDVLLVDYSIVATTTTGANVFINQETPTGSVNGSNTAFSLSRSYVSGSLQVYINGLLQAKTTHVTEVSASSGTFTLDVAPATGDVVRVSYLYAASTGGNAQTVNGITASTTPTPNQLLPLDSNGKISVANLTNPYKFMAHRATNQSISSNTFTKIQFATEDYDDNNNYDNSTNYRYTAPVTGLYFVNAIVQTLNGTSTTDNQIWLYKNGAGLRKGGNLKNGVYPQHQVVGQFKLTAGDYLEIFFINVAGADTIEGSTTSNTFEGHLICT